MSTPIAIWLADKLEDPESAHGYRLVANNAADELRRLQQENEQLKAQRKPLTPLEIENLRDEHLYSVHGVIQGHEAFTRAIEAAHGIKGDA